MIETDIDLTSANTMALPCMATALARISNIDELKRALVYARQHNLPTTVIGGGSNVLLPPKLNALVLKPVCNKVIVEEDDQAYTVRAHAGKNWHDLVTELLLQGCNGLENLALIPGLVGASVIQNIGAYGVEVGDFVLSVEAFDLQSGTVVILSRQQCLFTYRDSLFKQAKNRYWVNSVCFRLPKRGKPKYDYPALKQSLASTQNVSYQHVFDTVVAIRSQKLPNPKLIPNSGSFFKNPIVSSDTAEKLLKLFPTIPQYPQTNGNVKLAAAWLIEQCGWKGKQLGAVGMHTEQALVLVNKAQASLEGVLALQQEVSHAVNQKFNVALEREPVLVVVSTG